MRIPYIRWNCDICGGGGYLPTNLVHVVMYRGIARHQSPRTCEAVLEQNQKQAEQERLQEPKAAAM